MKKCFLAAIMLAGAYTLSAQQVASYQTTNDATEVNYVVPVPIKANFETTYPGISQVTWQPMNAWWYATYKDENNKLVRVYYNTQPYYLIRNETSKVALPVINTFVPDDVITNAVNNYGHNLYSITAVRSGNSEDVYYVTLIKDGKSEITTMNGTAVAYNKIDKPEGQE